METSVTEAPSTARTPIRVAVGGLGAVGMPVARWLDSGDQPGLELVAVSAGDKPRARTRLADFTSVPEILDLPDLAEAADIVIECAPPASFNQVSEPAVERGKILMPLTVTMLLQNWHLVDRARETGGRILVPTGALVGLDALRAAAEGDIQSVVMATRKPPAGLKNAKFVREQGLSLEGLTEAKCLYSGTVADAADKFPANVNVAVALSLAGIGPEKTRYEIWADPHVDRNTHRIAVEADATRFEMQIAGVPTAENPATGKLTPLSVIATLRGLVAPLKVGT